MYYNQSRSILAGVPQATLQGWLQQAQTAYANLMSGQKVVTASYAQGDGDRSVTYNMASLPNLTSWIFQLEAALGLNHGARRPLRPYFR